jgi:hypothetical protein
MGFLRGLTHQLLAILQMLGMLVDVFKSRIRLEAENLFLRRQLNIALLRAPPRGEEI